MPTWSQTFSHGFSSTGQGEGKENTKDECVHPCDDNKGQQIEQDWAEGRGAAASIIYILTVENTLNTEHSENAEG